MDITDENEIKLANWLSMEIIELSRQLFPLMEFVETEEKDDTGSKLYKYDEPEPEAKDILDILPDKYEEWCAMCRHLLEKHLPGELEDFNRSYKVAKYVLSFDYRTKVPNSTTAYMQLNKHLMTQVSIAGHLSKLLKQ